MSGSGNWWDPLPHKIYSKLEKVETDHPWFEVYRVHEWLYVIYEDGIFDQPVMYLVVGEDRAALIDGGSGIGRIDKVVEELTDKPYFLLLTHTHNDHIGGCKDFKEIALMDDVMSWERSAKGYGKAKMGEIIGEGYVIKDLPPDFDPDSYYAAPFIVTMWLQDNDIIELGGRKLEVLYTPGHASNHICLLDRDARYLFVGDNYYTGGISTYLPGGNHDDFIESCRRMVELLPHYDYLMSAHNQPLVEKEEAAELLKAAEEIKAGTATNYRDRMAIAADYNKPVRRYQYKRFSLTTDVEV